MYLCEWQDKGHNYQMGAIHIFVIGGFINKNSMIDVIVICNQWVIINININYININSIILLIVY